MSIQINSIIIIVLVLWIVSMQFQIRKMKKMHSNLMKISNKGNIADIIEKILSQYNGWQMKQQEIDQFIGFTKESMKYTLRQEGFVRYDSFQGVGGKQSFSLLLLTPEYNGIIISSLHDRVGTKMYAKEIAHGEPINDLSQEEQQLLAQVLNGPQ